MTVSLATADLHDAHPDRVRRCALPLIDYGAKRLFHGPARTVVTAEDTALAKSLFRQLGNGAVIVLDGGGSLNRALVGDIQAGILRDNGWSGLVINGAVRDTAVLATIDLGVKALGVSFVRPRQDGIGAIDVPVAFGGVLFTPGDHVYCDADGVLVTDGPLA